MTTALDKALEYVENKIVKLLKIHQGSANPNAMLDEWYGEQIRWTWEEDCQKEGLKLFLDDMALSFNVIRNKISNVFNYRGWRRVKPEMAKEGHSSRKDAEPSWYEKEFMKKLHEKSDIDPDTGCWIWQGIVNENSGDPMEKYRGAVQGVEPVVYQIHTGNIEIGYLWKICRNKTCVNPIHIRSSETLIDCLAHTPDCEISDSRYIQLGMEVVREYRKMHNVNRESNRNACEGTTPTD